MKAIQFINSTPEDLVKLFESSVEKKFENFKKEFQPKEPTKYVTRDYIANEMLHCNVSTVHNLTVKGILKKYGCGGRVLYKRDEVEAAIVHLKY
jgi:hypothetical protein